MKRLLTIGLCLLAASTQAGSHGGPKVGDVPPLLNANTLLQAPPDAELNAAFLQGNVVVLEFWATWCGPCVASISHLNDLADQFKDKPVRFIAVTAEDGAKVQSFLKKRPIHAWIALDTDRAMNKAFAVASIPHTVVLDKEGRIAAITHPTELTARHLTDLLDGKKVSLSDGRGEKIPNQKPEQAPEGKPPVFEISVRPSTATNGMTSWGNGQFKASPSTVWGALPVAFETTSSRIITNAPLPAGMYDFTITEPRGSEEEMPVLLQTALRIIFGVTGRKEVRQTPVFLLKTKTPTATGRTISPTETMSFSEGGGHISGIGISMKQLAATLEEKLGQPVIDKTGSKEAYDITLKWKETESDTMNDNALLTAVREQLGLELIPATRPVEMVIIKQSKTAVAKASSNQE